MVRRSVGRPPRGLVLRDRSHREGRAGAVMRSGRDGPDRGPCPRAQRSRRGPAPVGHALRRRPARRWRPQLRRGALATGADVRAGGGRAGTGSAGGIRTVLGRTGCLCIAAGPRRRPGRRGSARSTHARVASRVTAAVRNGRPGSPRDAPFCHRRVLGRSRLSVRRAPAPSRCLPLWTGPAACGLGRYRPRPVRARSMTCPGWARHPWTPRPGGPADARGRDPSVASWKFGHRPRPRAGEPGLARRPPRGGAPARHAVTPAPRPHPLPGIGTAASRCRPRSR